MIQICLTLLYFMLALLLLITVHELGHFLVARWCGVKVLRASFGFGKVWASWHDKRGTEFACSFIPLGGYIKMLDEAEGPVSPEERHLAFNNQSIGARMAIVLAGPLFNFLFAFLALWLVLVLGIKGLAPMISEIKSGSIAHRAGLSSKLEILSLNGRKTTSWYEVERALMPLIGTHEPIEITVKSLTTAEVTTRSLPLDTWQLDTNNPDLLGSLGMTPFVPSIPPIIGQVDSASPAALAGLQVGDVITDMNGEAISDFQQLLDVTQHHRNESIELGITRDKRHKTVVMTLGSIKSQGKTVGFLGVRSQWVDWPLRWQRTTREPPIQAIGTAFKQTIGITGTTLSLMSQLVMGKLSFKSLSGPVGIAQGAGDSAQRGLVYYLSFLALISISLGVVNLLPIPLLDGGQFLYCFIELLIRRPLSERLKLIGGSLGFMLLATMMIISVYNDISRLTG